MRLPETKVISEASKDYNETKAMTKMRIGRSIELSSYVCLRLLPDIVDQHLN